MFAPPHAKPWRPIILFWGLVVGALVAVSGNAARAQTLDLDACLAFSRPACDTVLATAPDNLTALFMRGLATELEGDDVAALKDFDAVATREPRHFGAQLWRFVAAASLGQSRQVELEAYLAGAQQLGPWPRALAQLYLGEVTPAETLALAGQQSGTAAAESICAAEYHLGRAASLAGKTEAAVAHFRAALATGAVHVFEYRAADRAVRAVP